jgi:hypothetical protein
LPSKSVLSPIVGRVALTESTNSGQLEDLKREQADVEGQLARLNKKVDEFEVQRSEATEAIERSRAVCEEIKFFTKQEAHRLKGMWLLVSAAGAAFTLTIGRRRGIRCISRPASLASRADGQLGDPSGTL